MAIITFIGGLIAGFLYSRRRRRYISPTKYYGRDEDLDS